MALKLLQPGLNPIGQFDALDAQTTTFKGGEVVTLKSVTATVATDKAASDSFDGYVNPSGTAKRPVVQLAADGYARPLMLSDDGVLGYGTLFGTVVGGTVGQTSYGPNSSVPSTALLGPHTSLGSGKVTCWDKPGLYAVSLDACDTAASTGLQPTNTTIDVGAALYYTSAGLLTPNASAAVTGSNNNVTTLNPSGSPIVGRLVAFDTNGSLVSTPTRLVAALNSPSGLISSVGLGQYAFATFYFAPPLT